MANANDHGREVVILIHGTGATDTSSSGERWWQDRGPLWNEIRSTFGGVLEIEAFIWTGANSESDRRLAGRRLATRIKGLTATGAKVHLVGHSHGGSVIWHAARQFERLGIDPAQVLSWATVGTPFLRYRLRRSRLAMASAMLLGAVATLVVMSWGVSEVEWRYAWFDGQMYVVLWALLALIPLIALCWSVRVVSTGLLNREAVESTRASAKWNRPDLKDRILILWSLMDEPILGLSASASFSLSLLQEEGSGKSSLRRYMLGLWTGGLNIVRRAVNQIANSAISRSVQGTTITHLEFAGCGPWPTSLAHGPLPPFLDSELVRTADTHAADLGKRARSILASGHDPITGFVDLQRAAAQAVSFRELVHTSYFDHLACRTLLIEHIATHSAVPTAHVASNDLQLWYSHRFLTEVATRGETGTFPSNRSWAVVSCFVSIIALTFALTSLSSRVVYETAMRPSTAAYWIENATHEWRLASALAGQEGIAVLTPAGLAEAAEFVQYQRGRFALTLDRYIRALSSRAGIERLKVAVPQLATPELRSLFFFQAFPSLLEQVPERDIDWLLAADIFFPNPNTDLEAVAAAKTFASDSQAPLPFSLSLAVYHLSGRRLLTPSRFDQLLSYCTRNPKCEDQLRVEQALTLAAFEQYQAADRYLPLPAMFTTATKGEMPSDAGIPRTSVWTIRALKPRRTPDSLGPVHALRWAVERQQWDYAATLAQNIRGKRAASVPWKSIEPAFVRAMEQTAKPTPIANAVLAVFVSAPIEGTIDDSLVARFQQILRLQVPDSPFGQVSKWQINSASIRHQSACQSEDCDSAAAKKFTKQRTVEQWMSKMRRADLHEGNESLLTVAKSPPLGYDRVKDAPIAIETFFSRLLNEICADRGPLLRIPANKAISESLIAISRSFVPTASVKRLIAYLEGGEFDCAMEVDSISLPKIESDLLSLAVPVVLWMYSNDEKRAVAIASRATHVLSQSSASDISEIRAQLLDLLIGAWDPVSVLSASTGDRYPLPQRAATLQMALCAIAAGREDLARRLGNMSQRVATLEYSVGTPKDLLNIYALEANLRARLADWRGAMTRCRGCSAEEELFVINVILPTLLTRRGATPSTAEMRCNRVPSEALDHVEKWR